MVGLHGTAAAMPATWGAGTWDKESCVSLSFAGIGDPGTRGQRSGGFRLGWEAYLCVVDVATIPLIERLEQLQAVGLGVNDHLHSNPA